uniref:Uncharacterized protein n=1 Tax=Timema cristinae TaxID=61476 RepID=A0A7R9DF74_TIMCR|nr:unnamed protein product [Timema cristinae]
MMGSLRFESWFGALRGCTPSIMTNVPSISLSSGTSHSGVYTLLNFSSSNMEITHGVGDNSDMKQVTQHEFKCTACQDVPEIWHDVSAATTITGPSGRADANYVSTCKFCRSKNSLCMY